MWERGGEGRGGRTDAVGLDGEARDDGRFEELCGLVQLLVAREQIIHIYFPLNQLGLAN